MNIENYRWLKAQLPEFAAKKIIDPQSADNLRSYCERMISAPAEAPAVGTIPAQTVPNVPQKTEQPKPAKNINWVPVILMIVSFVLVVGGLISLIAYNWAFISRTTKTIVAVAAMVGMQAAVLICKLKGKMEKTSVRESMGIAWALLFGGVIAFISQILRLPSNTSAFIAVWAISSVFVLYSTKSDIVFFFTLILGMSYVYATKFYGDSSSLIYIMFAALVPYALTHKSSLFKWALLIYAVSMMGFCLDKTVPGLWIVAYTSLLAIFAMSKNKYLSIAFSSALGFMLILLCLNYFWEDIGWQFIRTSPSHHLDGYILDLILSCGLFVFCIGLAIFKFFIKKEKDLRCSIALIPFVIFVLYALYSFFPDALEESALASCVLIFMGAVITVVLALRFSRAWFLVPFFGLMLQFILSPFYNPLVRSFFCLLFILALIAMRSKYLKIRCKPVVFLICRISLVIIFLSLTFWVLELKYTIYQALESRDISNIILYSLGTLGSFVLFFISLNRQKLKSILDLIVFPTLGFVISILINHCSKNILAGTTEISLMALSLLGLHSLMIRKKGRMSLYVFFIAFMLIPASMSVSGIIILIIAVAAWCMNLYSIQGNRVMGILSVIFGATALLFTAYSFPEFGNLFRLRLKLSTMDIVSFFASLTLFAASGLLALREATKNKKWVNPILFIHPLLLFIIFCIPNTSQSDVRHVLSSVCFVLLALFCIYYLVRASFTSSLAMANCATVFLGIAVLVKFFVEDYSLIAKGLVFIGLGIAVFLINIFLSRRNRNEK